VGAGSRDDALAARGRADEGQGEGLATMANTYDAIVIGGGHNGLISGAYFARSGARTVVLEARHKTGGAADTSAPFADHPEIEVTTYSYVMSLMPPTIIRELNLERHGYDVTPFGPYYQAFPDGRSIKIYADDAQKSYDSIAQFSRRDADTLPEWEAWLKNVADVLGPLLLQVPPKVGSLTLGDLMEQAKIAWKTRNLGVRGVADVTRLFTMSVTDLLNDWFESDAIKGMLAVNGVIGTWAGPDEPGTAYVMLHHSIGDVGDGHLGSWGFQQGGMGGVATACRRSAESFGADPYGEAVTNLGSTEEAGFADSAQITEQRSEALAQIDQARNRLQQIDEALERAREGTYGICVECGRPINPARLEARPLSIRCVECAATAS
jgi:RNA polymerase-binding protein DksA